MPCQCVPPPPPIFDLPPPPDPSLILHLLFDEPTTSSSSSSMDGPENFQQFSSVQSCSAASSSSSPSSVSAIFAGWWTQLQGAGGADFFLPWLALSLFCICLITSGAALALRWRRSRKMLRSNETILDGQSRKRPSTKSANTSMTSPTTLPLGGYSSSGTTSATDSPEHYVCGNAAHFSPHSSIETMASATTSPIDKKQQKCNKGGEGGWHFQPNFFAIATNVAANEQFRPNTVGASRRKILSSIGHHHPHHHLHPHFQCCSPPTTTISPPRTVALRMPRHFSSHEGQFVAWRTAAENADNGGIPTPCSFYGGFGGGNGSELYEELVGGENAEDIAEAPYKWRQIAQQQGKRMPPPSTRPPPPPAEYLPGLACSPNGNGGSPGSSLSGANSKGSDEGRQNDDSELPFSRAKFPLHDVGGSNYYSIAANGMAMGVGQQSFNNSRTAESGYGTAGRTTGRVKGCQRRNVGGNGGGGGGLWRNNPQQQIGGIKQPQQSPPLNQQKREANLLVEEEKYIEQMRRQKTAAMTYV